MIFCPVQLKGHTERSTTWKLGLTVDGDELRNVATVWIEIKTYFNSSSVNLCKNISISSILQHLWCPFTDLVF